MYIFNLLKIITHTDTGKGKDVPSAPTLPIHPTLNPAGHQMPQLPQVQWHTSAQASRGT